MVCARAVLLALLLAATAGTLSSSFHDASLDSASVREKTSSMDTDGVLSRMRRRRCPNRCRRRFGEARRDCRRRGSFCEIKECRRRRRGRFRRRRRIGFKCSRIRNNPAPSASPSPSSANDGEPGPTPSASTSPVAPDPSSTTPAAPPSPPPSMPPSSAAPVTGLFVTPSEVFSGEDVVLTFTVRPDGSADVASNPIQLFEGETGTGTNRLLGEALDDGSDVSGDTTAGDNIFTNTFSFNFANPGSQMFRAVIGNVVYTASVSVESERAVERSSISEEVSRSFQIDARSKGIRQALNDAFANLVNNLPSQIGSTDDVLLTSGDLPSLSWTTSDGLAEAIVPNYPTSFESNFRAITFGDVPVAASRFVQANVSKDISPESRQVTQLNCVRTFSASFFGFQSANFLPAVAGNAGVPSSRITQITSTGNSLESLKNLQRFEAVSIVSLSRLILYRSGGFTTRTQAILTDATVANAGARYRSDLLAKRIIVVNGFLAVTPEFFERYTGNFDGGAIYLGGTNTLSPDGYGSVFESKGVGAVFGHSGVWEPVDTWTNLFNGQNAGSTPCLQSSGCALATPASYDLSALCEDRPIPNLQVTYTWPLNQQDLDTGTQFLGSQVGFDCDETNPYQLFSGDDRTSGGMETAIIDLQTSFNAGDWTASSGVLVNLRAGWYTPAGGSGPASVTVRFEDGSSSSGVQSINPGSQSNCASTCVGVAFVSVQPRLTLTVEAGGSCNNPPDSSPSPMPMTGPNECVQNFFALLDYNPNGPGEPQVAFGNLGQIEVVSQINDDAFLTSQEQFQATVAECQFNACDAFRHAYFNYRLATAIGVDGAKAWADAHEVSNPNSIPVLLQDLTNNDVGRELSVSNPSTTREDAIAAINQAIQEGLLAVESVTTCGEGAGGDEGTSSR